MTARNSEVTASVVPSYGMRPVGGFGIRGWRVHCDKCGYLSRTVYTHIRASQSAQREHRCVIEVAA